MVLGDGRNAKLSVQLGGGLALVNSLLVQERCQHALSQVLAAINSKHMPGDVAGEP